MIKYLTVLTLLLAGCAQETTATFIPYTPEKTSDKVYQEDLNTCRNYAAAYLTGKSSLDTSQVAQEGLSGAIKGVPSIPLSPYVPALGGLSGASGEILSELGLDSQDAKKIVAWCLHDKGLRHGYSVWDPNL